MKAMKGQDSPGLGMLYITFFILLVGVGGYWILHSDTWFDYNVLYGHPSAISGKVVRIDPCEDPKKTIVLINTSKAQAYVYMSFQFDVAKGDYLSVIAYNVTGRGIPFDLTRSKCEPDGFHYYASKVINTRTGFEFVADAPG